MANSRFKTRQSDRTDRVTGLPRLPAALAELPAMMRDNTAERLLGVISIAVVPDTLLFRHSLDAVHRLRVEASRRIRASLRPQDRLYAVSQREWLIVLPNLLSPAALTLAMVRLRERLLALSQDTPGISHLPRLALGAARWPQDGQEPLFLVQSARIARLVAEQCNEEMRDYAPEMESESDEARQMLDELRGVLRDRQGLQLFLQPQVDIASGRCHGAEALLRWQRSNGEWVPPPVILDAIDRLGERQNFNRWLIQQAIHTQLALRGRGIAIQLSINLSANDLLDAELPEMLGQTLATWDVPAASLTLEITETMMVEESWQVIDVLERLRQLGVSLSIDDFGTGYAGMSYLQRLPVQEVKIEQMFVRQAQDSDKAREIITSIIQLASRLQMTIVAEGVEDADTLQLLADLGCRSAQGYHFSRPLPLIGFIDWLWQRSTPAS